MPVTRLVRLLVPEDCVVGPKSVMSFTRQNVYCQCYIRQDVLSALPSSSRASKLSFLGL